MTIIKIDQYDPYIAWVGVVGVVEVRVSFSIRSQNIYLSALLPQQLKPGSIGTQACVYMGKLLSNQDIKGTNHHVMNVTPTPGLFSSSSWISVNAPPVLEIELITRGI